jgi:hypothetical protein
LGKVNETSPLPANYFALTGVGTKSGRPKQGHELEQPKGTGKTDDAERKRRNGILQHDCRSLAGRRQHTIGFPMVNVCWIEQTVHERRP